MKVIFLDIDGVLNGHEWIHLQEGPRINPGPAHCLQILLQRTEAKVVISSTWRSWVHRGMMTVEGFGSMLATHGIDADVIDVLPLGPVESRAQQIQDWIKTHRPDKYVVLDDLDMPGLARVRPRPHLGLREMDVTRAVLLLS